MKKTLLTLMVALATSFATLNAQNVNIPDANFKAYLLADPNINTNSDTEIQVSEAQAFTGIGASIIIYNNIGIADLTGIEAFTGLTQLVIKNNLITTLDLNNNTALLYVFCEGNQLTSINIGNCVLLEEFWCDNNQLTSIDVSNNTALRDFRCTGNPLTSLDLSNNAALQQIYFWGASQLTSLNVANGNNTNITAFKVVNSTLLTCIQVDDAAYSTANWTGSNFEFTVGVSFSENCVTAPNAPTNLVATLVGNDVNLSWQDNSNDEDGFEVRAPQSLGDTTGNWNQAHNTNGANITNATIGTSSADGLYCFKVRAYKFNGNYVYSDFTEIECVQKGTVGINEMASKNGVSIYPNPANVVLNIDISTTLNAGENTNITIVNLLGETVATQTLHTGSNSIDVSDLVSGVYFLQTENGLATKFIKQ